MGLTDDSLKKLAGKPHELTLDELKHIVSLVDSLTPDPENPSYFTNYVKEGDVVKFKFFNDPMIISLEPGTSQGIYRLIKSEDFRDVEVALNERDYASFYRKLVMSSKFKPYPSKRLVKVMDALTTIFQGKNLENSFWKNMIEVFDEKVILNGIDEYEEGNGDDDLTEEEKNYLKSLKNVNKFKTFDSFVFENYEGYEDNDRRHKLIMDLVESINVGSTHDQHSLIEKDVIPVENKDNKYYFKICF
jgi:hypothetical protein